MKKIIVAPDSFKGTVTSSEFCTMASETAKRYYPDCEVVKIPVADGGEGTTDCFLEAMGGEKCYREVSGPFFEKIRGFYAILPDGTAVIEMAAAAALPMVFGKENPALTTTYGVGELIAGAVLKGSKNIIIGLGGSATNDAAAGCLSALGVKFFDKNGKKFIPTGGTLKDIADFDDTDFKAKYGDVKITAMCDIDNPLYGKKGAAYVFAPQKGADRDMVEMLDSGLIRFAEIIKQKTGKDISNVPGAGAAGGMGGGLYAFGAELKKGIDCVLDTVSFDSLLDGTDMVITGEGKIDSQSLRGKVVIGIAGRTKKKNVPLIAVVGDIGDDMEPAYDAGVSLIYSTNRVAQPFEKIRLRSKNDLALTLDTVFRSSKIFADMK